MNALELAVQRAAFRLSCDRDRYRYRELRADIAAFAETLKHRGQTEPQIIAAVATYRPAA